MRATNPSIKNATEARAHLLTKGWALAGEDISLDTLARTLFAVVAENGKLGATILNPLLSVAYLITEKIDAAYKNDISEAFSKHLIDAILPIAANFESKLDSHHLAIEKSTTAHHDLSEKIANIQNKLDETNDKVQSNAKSYSQAVASSLPPTQNPQNTTHANIQIRNREEIKHRQVLVNFSRTDDNTSPTPDEQALSQKALEALNNTWSSTPDPKPAAPKLKGATLLRNGGLLLELDTNAAASWLKETPNRESFLARLGDQANIKDRLFQVILHFVPIQFDPENPAQLREYEAFNGLEPHSVQKAEWIKAPKDRHYTQRVATLRVFHRDAKSANKILDKGASILTKRVTPKKPKKEPIRCLNCQKYGHERRNCHAASPSCARCAGSHATDACPTDNFTPKCVNCSGHHTSFNRDCPTFWDKCLFIDRRCPENKLVFYPTDEPWTWVTFDHSAPTNPPPPPRPMTPPANNHQQHPAHHHHHPSRCTGSNNVPLGLGGTYSQFPGSIPIPNIGRGPGHPDFR